MAFGQSIDQRKQNKRNHLVALFRERGDLSKAQARQLSGYSMDTLIALFKGLEDDGYIEPVEGTGGSRGKGRPAELYRLIHGKELYWGLTFNQSGVWSTLVGFGGEELDARYDELPELSSQAELVDSIDRHVAAFAERNAERLGSLRRIGLSLPGYIDVDAGILVRYNLMPFISNLDLRPIVRRHLPDLPIAVQHNITGLASMLLREKEIIESHRRILYVSARSGAAHALIQDGRIVMHDGEMGHLAVTGSDKPCRCGRIGCLDTLFSAAEFHRLCPHSSWEELSRILGTDSPAAAALWPIVEPPFRAMAEALLDLTAAFSPDLVVLSGELFSILPDPASWVQLRVAEAFSGPTPPWVPSSIEYRKTGAESAALGLCRSLIDEDWAWRADPVGQ
jgi:predicted NBD/HSP70 family sugar kinase